MKNLKLLVVALVAMFGFSSCNKDCGHDFIEVDYSNDIVGTWTCLEPDHSAAYIFNADGTLSTTGFDGDAHWEDEKGTYSVVNNKITMKFESGRIINGSFDIIPGKTISIVGEKGRHTYEYCKEDFSDEVVGMWVCTYVSTNNEDFNIYQDAEMAINIYQEDGKSIFTGFVIEANDYKANVESTYKVIGDLMLESNPLGEGVFQYNAFRLTYSPNSNQLGDMLTKTSVMAFDDEVIEFNASMLRVKESLNFTGQTYDYVSAYVTNAKGKDEDFTIMGHTFNMAKINSDKLDAMFRSILSCLEVNANSIKYTVNYNGQDIVSNDPITIDGNKVTLDMGVEYPGLRKVDMYMFQSANDSQLHIYMPTSAFVNYFANLLIPTLVGEGKLDTADTAAVDAVFAAMDARIESINVSLVYKARN